MSEFKVTAAVEGLVQLGMSLRVAGENTATVGITIDEAKSRLVGLQGGPYRVVGIGDFAHQSRKGSKTSGTRFNVIVALKGSSDRFGLPDLAAWEPDLEDRTTRILLADFLETQSDVDFLMGDTEVAAYATARRGVKLTDVEKDIFLSLMCRVVAEKATTTATKTAVAGQESGAES